MDLKLSEAKADHFKDVPPPYEIPVEVGNGVRGIFAFPHAIDQDDYLTKGFCPATSKVALLLHGQGGHKDYCYQKLVAHRLAADLGMYSLRIDFRGCGDLDDHEDIKLGRTLDLDLEDIDLCISYLKDSTKNAAKRNLDILALIGHSRGSLAMMLWVAKQDELLKSPATVSEGTFVPNVINCSSRFRSHTVLDRYPVLDDSFELVMQTCLRRGKYQQVPIYKNELRSLALADTNKLKNLSVDWNMMSIYGSLDQIIPRDDCAYISNALNRGPATHHLELILDADHNFYSESEIHNAADAQDFNPHNLPLTKKKLVNYNYVVSNLIADFLSFEQELKRFDIINRTIGMQPRFKTIDKISNFRDLGGWKVEKPVFDQDSKSQLYVRPGFMFRCANPSQVGDKGADNMAELQIAQVFDFRSIQECESDGIPEVFRSGRIKRQHVPVFKHQNLAPDALATHMAPLIISWHTYVNLYDEILRKGNSLFRAIFEHIRDSPDVPFVFHCTAGKDRTGVFGMLILLLAGVEHHTIAKEYALTTYGLQPDHEQIRNKFFAKLNEKPERQFDINQLSLGRKGWTLERDGFDNLIGSRTETMLLTIELFNDKYGGILKYMEENLKFSKDDVMQIHRNITTKVKPGTSARRESRPKI